MIYDASLLQIVGFLLIAGHYLVSGISELTPGVARHHIGMLRIYRVPFPPVAYGLGLALKLTGCALLLSGRYTEIGAYCLIVFTVVATGIYCRFWIMEEPVRRNLSRALFSVNVAVLGALLLILANVR